jgi:hypothetical protein
LALVKSFTEYFKSKTADLGNYYGILKQPTRSHNGERMQMDDFIEVSAVITSEHTGKAMQNNLWRTLPMLF